MKTKRIYLLAMMVLVLMMAGCATFAKDQYRALALTQETYNLAWGNFKKLYDEKAVDSKGNIIIDDFTYANGLKFANQYYDAWQAWIDSVIAYEKVKTPEAKLTVEQKANLFREISIKFLDLIEPYIKKGGL